MPSIRKLSFSITTLFLLTALAASVVLNFMFRNEMESLKTANRNMANELLSEYQLTDLGKIHWAEIQQPTKMMWRFRVFIPQGTRMQLNYAIAPASDGLPTPMRSFDEIIEGSDQLQTITIQIRQMSGTTVKIDAFINGDFAHGCVSMAPKQFAWLDQLEEMSNGFAKTEQSTWPNLANPKGNVILMQKSESNLVGSMMGGTPKIASPPNEFTIWLEPVD